MPVSRARRVAAEYNTNHPPVIAFGCRNQIVARRPNIAGLHTFGAGIGFQHLIVGAIGAALEGENLAFEQMIILREPVDNSAGQRRHILGRRHLTPVRQA